MMPALLRQASSARANNAPRADPRDHTGPCFPRAAIAFLPVRRPCLGAPAPVRVVRPGSFVTEEALTQAPTEVGPVPGARTQTHPCLLARPAQVHKNGSASRDHAVAQATSALAHGRRRKPGGGGPPPNPDDRSVAFALVSGRPSGGRMRSSDPATADACFWAIATAVVIAQIVSWVRRRSVSSKRSAMFPTLAPALAGLPVIG